MQSTKLFLVNNANVEGYPADIKEFNLVLVMVRPVTGPVPMLLIEVNNQVIRWPARGRMQVRHWKCFHRDWYDFPYILGHIPSHISGFLI